MGALRRLSVFLEYWGTSSKKYDGLQREVSVRHVTMESMTASIATTILSRAGL